MNGIRISHEQEMVVVSRDSTGHWATWLLVTAAGCAIVAICLSVSLSALLGMASPRDLALAILFVLCAMLPCWVLRVSFFALLPVRYELSPLKSGGVRARWRLGLMRSRWHTFASEPHIAVTPAYQRGDWGFALRLRSEKERSFCISASTLSSDSIGQAMQAGISMAEAIGSRLGIPARAEGWNLNT